MGTTLEDMLSQSDVLQVLQEQRLQSEGWFSVRQVKEALQQKGFSNGVLKGVPCDLFRLACARIIDARGVGVWEHRKEFRAIKKGGNIVPKT